MTAESQVPDAYEAVLVDLRARRDSLDQMIRQLEALRAGGAPVPASGIPQSATPPQSEVESGMFLGMSITDATKKLLAMKKRPLSNSEIAGFLKAGGMVMSSADPNNTVGSIITRRFNSIGDIVRVERGIWGLREWYPGRSFNKPAKGNGDVEVKSSANAPEQPEPPEPDDFSDLA